MSISEKIQQLAIKFIARQCTLREFRDQFVPLLVSVNRKTDAEAVTLGDTIENLYADFLAGELNEQGLRQKIVQLTPIVTAQIKFEWAFCCSAGTESAKPNMKPVIESSSNAQVLEYT